MPASAVGRGVDWDVAYDRYGPQLRQVESEIETQEQRFGLSLTPAAVELILLPCFEELERTQDLPEGTIKETVRKVIEEAKRSPDPRDQGSTRSVFSIARAWWKRWCDIPPICRPTDE
jgi:hypothetical protein